MKKSFGCWLNIPFSLRLCSFLYWTIAALEWQPRKTRLKTSTAGKTGQLIRSPKVFFSFRPHNNGFLGPTSRHSKQHVDRFSRFNTAFSREQQSAHRPRYNGNNSLLLMLHVLLWAVSCLFCSFDLYISVHSFVYMSHSSVNAASRLQQCIAILLKIDVDMMPVECYRCNYRHLCRCRCLSAADDHFYHPCRPRLQVGR